MTSSVVLRFRDFEPTTSTIAEHKKIIVAAGGVWWGWWKKDTEVYPVVTLERLTAQVGHGAVDVGLFDRSNDTFFVATAQRDVKGEQKNRSPEPDKTPRYYAQELLPLWLYLTEIRSVSREEFVERFGGVPKSPETTLFAVRGKILEDNDKFVRYCDHKTSGTKILHISDVHLGGDYGYPEARGPAKLPLMERLAADADGIMQGKPDLIVFSGDITTKADIATLRQGGLKFLQSLRDLYGLPEERFLVVPGNHDFPLGEAKPSEYGHDAEFRKLLKDFYGYDRETTGLYHFESVNGISVQFLTINSVRLRKPSESNLGYVEWGLYKDRLATHPKDAQVRIATMHHHLLPVPGEEELDEKYPYASVSATIDAGTVVEGLQANSFDLVLHGHQHVPGHASVARSIRDDGSKRLVAREPLSVLAAGSVGSSRLTNYMPYNSYNIIDLKRVGDDVTIDIRATQYRENGEETKLWFEHSGRVSK